MGSTMRKLLTVLLLLALALPASAQNIPGVDFNPEFVVKLHVLPGLPPQGIWQFGNGQYLITQDIDGRKDSEWVRFNLVAKDGDIIRKWEVPYGTHGQSLFLRKTGDGFTIYTESRNRKGLAVFHLNADKTELTFVKQITPRTADGETVDFEAFGVDEFSDLVLLAKSGGERKAVQYFRFSDFENGFAKPVSDKIVIETRDGLKLGSLQGVGTSNGVGYVLTGDSELRSKKYIFRIGLDGSLRPISISPGRARALFTYEPEGLFVQRGKVMFSMYDHFWTRIYQVAAE